jgi:hypothetical protein
MWYIPVEIVFEVLKFDSVGTYWLEANTLNAAFVIRIVHQLWFLPLA